MAGIKSIHFIFIGNDCGKLVIEVHAYWVFVLSLHFFLRSCELVQPLALIILRTNDVVVPNVNLEGILVVELDGLIYLPVLAYLLAFTVLSNQLLREKLDPDTNSFRIVFDSSHFDRKSVQFAQFSYLLAFIVVDILPILPPQLYQVILFPEVPPESPLDQNGAPLHHNIGPSRELAANSRLQ